MILRTKISFKQAALFFSIVVVYFLFCKFGILITSINEKVSSVWPAAGAGFALTLIFGYKYLPALFLGDLVANLSKLPFAFSDPFIAFSNTLAIFLAVYVYKNYYSGKGIFDSTKNTIFFIVISSNILAFVSALGGIIALYLNGFIEYEKLFEKFISWFLADYTGTITVAPFFLAASFNNSIKSDKINFAIVLSVVFLLGYLIFGINYSEQIRYYPFPLIFIPIIVYSAFMLSYTSITFMILVIESISIIGTASGYGPYSEISNSDPFLLIQIFIIVTTVTTLILKSVIVEKENFVTSLNESKAKLKDLNLALERNIKERTNDLTKTLNELKITEELYRNIYDNAIEGVFLADENGKILKINNAFLNLFGYENDNLLIKNINQRKELFENEEFFDDIMYSLKSKGYIKDYELKIQTPQDITKWISLSAREISNNEKTEKYYTGIIFDITKMKMNEQKLMHHASHDDLTGLTNRFMFRVSFDKMIKLADRNEYKLGVIYLDLDDFKKVNDNFGHYVGDQLLIETSKRITGNLRESDLIARMGGDEFIIILNNIEKEEDVESISKKIINSLSQPFILFENECKVGVSIGISIFPDDSNESQELIKKADHAMYKAKENGKNQFCRFS